MRGGSGSGGLRGGLRVGILRRVGCLLRGGGGFRTGYFLLVYAKS